MRIVVVGSINMDLVARAERMPRLGETVKGYEFFTAPGGKGANQAVAAAKLGAKTVMVGAVGMDLFGEQLKRSLTADSVDIRHICDVPGIPTGVASIWLDREGRNSIVIVPGANDKLTPDRLPEEAFEGADGVLLQLEIPVDTVVRAEEIAKAKGAKVFLNTAPALPLPEKAFELCDFVILNEEELKTYVNTPEDTIERALRLAKGKAVIVTLGEKGSMWVEKEETVYVPAFEVEAVDTVAAGDAFVAAFAIAYLEGKNKLETLRFANAAGAIAVTRRGAQPSLPTREEVERFLAEKT